jgi:hypothetical protein
MMVADVVDYFVEAFFIIDVLIPTAFGPPTLTAGAFFQSPSAPSLKLLTRDVERSLPRADEHMNMIGAAVHGMQSPFADNAMLSDSRFHESALRSIKHNCLFAHAERRCEREQWIWQLQTPAPLEPAASITWQPRAVGRPSREISNRHVSPTRQRGCFCGINFL